MKRILIIALAIPFVFSCKKNDETNPTELTHVKSIVLNELELENLQRLTVFDDGSFLLNTHSPALNAVSHIYKYSSEGTYLGRFLDKTADSAKTTFYNFFQEADQNLKFFSLQNYSSPQIREYKTDGSFVSNSAITGLSSNNITTFFYGHWAFALDNDKNFYTVSSDMAGTNNEMIKVSSDLSTKIKHLKVEDIKKLFPGQNGEQIRLTSIAYHNSQLYITIDRIAEDGDSDKDGVLILDKDFNLVKFFGNNWMFNGPCSICFDGNFMYVLCMYSKEIKVFDESFSLVAKFANKTDNYILNSPISISVKGDYVYEVDSKDNKKQISVFNKYK